MSANTQNFVYKFGKKIPGAKENIMTQERLNEIRKSAEKYLQTDEPKTGKAKQ